MYNKGGLFNYQFQQLLNINAIFSILDFHFLAYKFLLFIIYELNSVRHCFSDEEPLATSLFNIIIFFINYNSGF